MVNLRNVIVCSGLLLGAVGCGDTTYNPGPCAVQPAPNPSPSPGSSPAPSGVYVTCPDQSATFVPDGETYVCPSKSNDGKGKGQNK